MDHHDPLRLSDDVARTDRGLVAGLHQGGFHRGRGLSCEHLSDQRRTSVERVGLARVHVERAHRVVGDEEPVAEHRPHPQAQCPGPVIRPPRLGLQILDDDRALIGDGTQAWPLSGGVLGHVAVIGNLGGGSGRVDLAPLADQHQADPVAVFQQRFAEVNDPLQRLLQRVSV